MAPPRRAENTRVGHRVHPQLTALPGGQDVAPPDPPAGIRKGSRAFRRWQALWTSELARVINRHTDIGRLERWILAVDEWDRVQRTLRKTRLVRGSTGQPVLNPLAAYAQDLERTIEKAEDAYGMTPKARLGLGLDVAALAKTANDLNRMIEEDDDGRGPAADGPERVPIPGGWVEG